MCALEDSMNRKKFRRTLFTVASLLIVCFVAAIAVTVVKQNKKLDELYSEKQRLTERLDELKRDYERVEGLIEYSGSEEFLLRYARENLGYLYENDIRFTVGAQPAEGE